MYSGLLHLHSGLRWFLLIAIVGTIIISLTKWTSGKAFTANDKRFALFSLIFSHTQLIIGLILYFISPKVIGLGEAMGDSVYRFHSLEHPLTMIIAIVLITIGYSKSKRIDVDVKKFKTLFWYYFIALLLMLAMIPWPWQKYGAGWG